VNQISDANPGGPPAQAQPAPPQDPVPATDESAAIASSFGSRGRARRRLRFLRKARELAYRDLGGLVFNLHRFVQRNDPLVLDKLNTLGHIDRELRTLEGVLSEHSPVTVLREAGITACPRCAAIHSSEDRFCPNCGIAMGRNADLPIAGVPTSAPLAAAPPPAPAQPQVSVPPATPAPAAAPPAPAPPARSTAAPVAATPGPPPAAPPSSPPPAGRSPHPPSAAPKPAGEQGPQTPRDAEELTEILRPPAQGT
jgi:hypothetical protein